MSYSRTSIRGVRALGAGLALIALVAIPAGSFLLNDPSRAGSGLGHVFPAPTEAQPPQPALESAPETLAPAVLQRRAKVRSLLELETGDLVSLAKAQPDQRRVVLNILWGRDAHEEARALAASDQTLTPKLAALEARDRR